MSQLDHILSIEGLRTAFPGGDGGIAVVDDVSLSVKRGHTIAIVGESGCGKSMLSLSIMGLVPPPGRVVSGKVLFDGRDLRGLPKDEMRMMRGRRIAMIFQDPMSSLNPAFPVGDQIVEQLRVHFPSAPSSELRGRALEALEQVRIPEPARRFHEYPHQLSGGMRQRVMIAMALCCKPDVLIADEPTTALDVTVQAQILALLRALQAETGTAIILITHDLGVVAEMAHDVAVMYAGRIVESAPSTSLFDNPQHPYTIGLLASIPRLENDAERLVAIDGSVPPPHAMPSGCRFRQRCVFAIEACAEASPALALIDTQHHAACIRAPLERFVT